MIRTEEEAEELKRAMIVMTEACQANGASPYMCYLAVRAMVNMIESQEFQDSLAKAQQKEKEK